MAHPFLTCAGSLSFLGGAFLWGCSASGASVFAGWAPAGIPIGLAALIVPVEAVSFCLRAVIVGGRVAANLTAGHLLTSMANGFCGTATVAPLVFTVFPFLFGLEAGVAIVQAYVAVILLAATWAEM